MKEKLNSEKIYLIDGYGLIYRSYFAFAKAPRINPNGENASAVFGFFLSLFSLLKARNPGYLAVIMDSTTPTFRHVKYPAYKEKREKTPQDLHDQVSRIENILNAMGIPVFRQDGFEADDLISSIARWCQSQDIKCGIFTKDKDLFQLVQKGIFILYNEKGQDFADWGREEVFKNKGVYPEQIVDFLSLTGDSSDNIPGVAGVGEKTAIKLLEDYKTLDGIYANLSAIKSDSQRKKLEAGKDSAYLSRELILLNQDVQLNISLPDLQIKEADNTQVLAFFHKEGIKIFDKELLAGGAVAEQPVQVEKGERGKYRLLTDLAELDRWIAEAKKKGVFAFDSETDNIDTMRANPIGFSFTCEEKQAYYLPVRAIGVQCLPEDEVRTRLKKLLQDEKLKLVGQNFKYDYKVLYRWGIEVKNVYFDTMLAAWVLDSTANTYNMDKLAERFLNYTTIHYADLIPKKEAETTTLADIEISRVVDYAGEDADITFRLYNFFARELDKPENNKLKALFFDVEMPLLTVLAHMEMRGIKLLPDFLNKYSKELQKKLGIIEQEIYKMCGREFNIRSTKELQVMLFDIRGLKPIKKTKTGNSTDSQVLEMLASEDPVVEKILEHRLLSKLKSTYVDTLPKLINPVTHRIHTSFLQTGTATGRIASNDPNLQNIPVRDEEGRKIRSAFVPEAGCYFLSADYSQIELVVLGHLAQERNLIEAFKTNTDIHTHTAALLFGVDEKEVTPLQRRIGKTINFGVIYGMSAFRLSREMKIPRKDADNFIAAYFAQYSGVEQFKTGVIKQAEAQGYVETILGRRRKLLNINNKNKTVKMADERIAVNTPIQGSAADIVKLAMLKIAAELKKRKLKSVLLLQVHDELILEVPEDELEVVQKLVKKDMESVYKLDAPLKVNIEIRESWDQIH